MIDDHITVCFSFSSSESFDTLHCSFSFFILVVTNKKENQAMFLNHQQDVIISMESRRFIHQSILF